MDRGAWGATAHGNHKESDTKEQLTLFQKMNAMQSHFRIFLK